MTYEQSHECKEESPDVHDCVRQEKLQREKRISEMIDEAFALLELRDTCFNGDSRAKKVRADRESKLCDICNDRTAGCN